MEINMSKEINIYKSISRIMVMIPWLILCWSRFDCVMADFVQFGILSNIWLCQYFLLCFLDHMNNILTNNSSEWAHSLCNEHIGVLFKEVLLHVLQWIWQISFGFLYFRYDGHATGYFFLPHHWHYLLNLLEDKCIATVAVYSWIFISMSCWCLAFFSYFLTVCSLSPGHKDAVPQW